MGVGVQLIVQFLRAGWCECLDRRSDKTILLTVEGVYVLLVMVIRVPVRVGSMMEFTPLHVAGSRRADGLHVGHVAGPLTQR